jgi:hypothetical protein
METKPVFEWQKIPEDIRAGLIIYYRNTGQHPIYNDSFVRYPYLFDLQNGTPIDDWFIENGAKIEDRYIIIHFEW